MSFSDFLELMSEIMTQTTRWGNLSTKLSGYVGFDTVQEQIRKKSLKRGFELNIMVVGRCLVWSGLGTGNEDEGRGVGWREREWVLVMGKRERREGRGVGWE